jgi:hypothetical protein
MHKFGLEMLHNYVTLLRARRASHSAQFFGIREVRRCSDNTDEDCTLWPPVLGRLSQR